MKLHSFKDSIKKGKLAEDIISQYFIDLGYEIHYLKIEEQNLLSYDFKAIRFDKEFNIEVKYEYLAEKTGNVFYETEVDNKPGWCMKYGNDSDVIIIWYLPISETLLCLPAKKLKSIPYEKYPKRTVTNIHKNGYYKTFGYLIPLTYMYQICKVVTVSTVVTVK